MTTLKIPASEFVKRFQAGEIPKSAHVTVTYEGQEIHPQDQVLAKLHDWQYETATQTSPQIPAQELFRQWDKEDATMTEAEKLAENGLWDEVQKGINETRAELEMRQL